MNPSATLTLLAWAASTAILWAVYGVAAWLIAAVRGMLPVRS